MVDAREPDEVARPTAFGAFAANVRSGLRWGAWLACAYSLLGLLLALLGTDFDSQGVTVFQVLAVYWFGGLVGGLIVGMLWPLGQWSVGAIVLGSLALVPVFAGITLVDKPFPVWGGGDFVEIAVLSCLIGGPVGFLVWRDNRS